MVMMHPSTMGPHMSSSTTSMDLSLKSMTISHAQVYVTGDINSLINHRIFLLEASIWALCREVAVYWGFAFPHRLSRALIGCSLQKSFI